MKNAHKKKSEFSALTTNIVFLSPYKYESFDNSVHI